MSYSPDCTVFIWSTECPYRVTNSRPLDLIDSERRVKKTAKRREKERNTVSALFLRGHQFIYNTFKAIMKPYQVDSRLNIIYFNEVNKNKSACTFVST